MHPQQSRRCGIVIPPGFLGRGCAPWWRKAHLPAQLGTGVLDGPLRGPQHRGVRLDRSRACPIVRHAPKPRQRQRHVQLRHVPPEAVLRRGQRCQLFVGGRRVQLHHVDAPAGGDRRHDPMPAVDYLAGSNLRRVQDAPALDVLGQRSLFTGAQVSPFPAVPGPREVCKFFRCHNCILPWDAVD